MSKLIEILSTLKDGESVCFCKSKDYGEIKMTAYKVGNDFTRREISRLIFDDLLSFSILDQLESIELQDMLTKLRERAEGKEQ